MSTTITMEETNAELQLDKTYTFPVRGVQVHRQCDDDCACPACQCSEFLDR